jgi:hypothetical protein
MRRTRDERGQAAAELVAVIPLLLVLLLGLAQLSLAGYALWSAAEAARNAARASTIGGDARSAALGALPEWLEHGAEVATSGPVRVTVNAPALLPGVPAIAVSASTDLDPEASRDG